MRKPRIGLDGRKTHFLTGGARNGGKDGNVTLRFVGHNGRRVFTRARAKQEAEVIVSVLYDRVPRVTVQEIIKLIESLEDFDSMLPDDVTKWLKERS